MLFSSWEVHIVKNYDLGLENAAWVSGSKAGNMELCCPLGIMRWQSLARKISQKPMQKLCNKYLIDQACSVTLCQYNLHIWTIPKPVNSFFSLSFRNTQH